MKLENPKFLVPAKLLKCLKLRSASNFITIPNYIIVLSIVSLSVLFTNKLIMFLWSFF